MLDLIVNPIAGGKKGKKMAKNLALIEKRLKERNAEYTIRYTERVGHAKELTKELINGGATCIVAVGGDGTLHEIVNGFHSFDKCALGIIPCGTGNDFASAIGLGGTIEETVDLILDGTPKFTDFIELPTVRSINIVGMGIDVEVLKKYAALKKKTKFGYTKCLLKTLFKFDCVNFSAEIDGEKTDYNAFMACVANGSAYGGGIRICPVADPADKSLDFVAVDKLGKFKLLGALIKLKGGKILSIPQATHKKITKIKIEASLPYVVQADGELYENIPFEAEIVSDKLRIYR